VSKSTQYIGGVYTLVEGLGWTERSHPALPANPRAGRVIYKGQGKEVVMATTAMITIRDVGEKIRTELEAKPPSDGMLAFAFWMADKLTTEEIDVLSAYGQEVGEFAANEWLAEIMESTSHYARCEDGCVRRV
jgi:hypothetical protein